MSVMIKASTTCAVGRGVGGRTGEGNCTQKQGGGNGRGSKKGLSVDTWLY